MFKLLNLIVVLFVFLSSTPTAAKKGGKPIDLASGKPIE